MKAKHKTSHDIVMKYSNILINNNIRRVLEEGKSNDDALDLFLMMNMMNDLGTERSFVKKGPSSSDVHMNLIGNNVIDKDDFKLQMASGKKFLTQRLVVRLSPNCTLYAETNHSSLQVCINEKNMTTMYLKSYHAEDIAMWMIRQKLNINRYLEGWNDVLNKACKKAKGNRMALLAIRAIFADAMKDYPDTKYEIIEQKRRARIRVTLPKGRLGVFLDAWWGSYKEKLPPQIESLKILIEAHRKNILTNFCSPKS